LPRLPVKFTRIKNQHFATQGRLDAPIHLKFGTLEGHIGPLERAKFHVNRSAGWERGAKKWQKFPLFGKESPSRGEPFGQFLHLLKAFIRPTTLLPC